MTSASGLPVTKLCTFVLVALSACAAFATPARVAYEAAYDHWVLADVVQSGADTVVVVQGNTAPADTLPLRALGIVEIYRGRRTSGANVVFGGLVGVLAGYLVGALVFNAQNEGCSDICELGAIAYVGVGAAVGGGAGLILGAIPVRSWTRIYVSPGAHQWVDTHRTWPR